MFTIPPHALTSFNLNSIACALYIIPGLALIMCLWCLINAPMRWQQQKDKALSAALAVGVSLTTTTGIEGIVCTIADTYIIIRTSQGIIIQITHAMIASIHED